MSKLPGYDLNPGSQTSKHMLFGSLLVSLAAVCNGAGLCLYLSRGTSSQTPCLWEKNVRGNLSSTFSSGMKGLISLSQCCDTSVGKKSLVITRCISSNLPQEAKVSLFWEWHRWACGWGRLWHCNVPCFQHTNILGSSWDLKGVIHRLYLLEHSAHCMRSLNISFL